MRAIAFITERFCPVFVLDICGIVKVDGFALVVFQETPRRARHTYFLLCRIELLSEFINLASLLGN